MNNGGCKYRFSSVIQRCYFLCVIWRCKLEASIVFQGGQDNLVISAGLIT